ncbi:Indoleamine 2,3-dioxygenase [Polychytrium aggregatum]|uniref:Indoleamine 2,3-dioxygenase n=1 Tax=Polychytrium aggregatum TaxID=110093 RepID=UPI0022FF13F5|nr:Indoleamine 2,3-dioxygenase [Polychytrium aggregatum]KAI9208574.1 Indoleamine 2,3-dioxygenase [Polychytrium aggregatum]
MQSAVPSTWTPPRLEDYLIDAVYGFLPVNPPPLRRLPEYFEPWELLLDDISALLLVGALRTRIEKLPVMDTSKLSNLRETQRAYLVLSYLAHGYVWQDKTNVAQILPKNIAVPWNEVSTNLGHKPVLSYAAVELYNYKLLDPEGPCDLSNMATLHTFTGGTDESWFFLVSLGMEAVGAHALPAIVAAQSAIARHDLPVLSQSLSTIADAIKKMEDVLVRMYEKNDPHIFYYRIRPFVAGWEGSDDLPKGLFYEGIPDENGSWSTADGSYRKYAGGSAGQSALIHSIDAALGIEHFPTRNRALMNISSATNSPSASNPALHGSPAVPKPAAGTAEAADAPRKNVMLEMRNYMPGPHRAFVEAIASGPSIKEFVRTLSDVVKCQPTETSEQMRQVCAEFNVCVDALKSFRDSHMKMVALYIVSQSRKRTQTQTDANSPDSRSRQIPNSLAARGTGGTNLIPFLKQSRQETVDVRVDLE